MHVCLFVMTVVVHVPNGNGSVRHRLVGLGGGGGGGGGVCMHLCARVCVYV